MITSPETIKIRLEALRDRLSTAGSERDERQAISNDADALHEEAVSQSLVVRAAVLRIVALAWDHPCLREDDEARHRLGLATCALAQALKKADTPAGELAAVWRRAVWALGRPAHKRHTATRQLRGRLAFQLGMELRRAGAAPVRQAVAYRKAVFLLDDRALKEDVEARETLGKAALNLGVCLKEAGAATARQVAAYQIAVRALSHRALRIHTHQRLVLGVAAYGLGSKLHESDASATECSAAYRIALRAVGRPVLHEDAQIASMRSASAHNLVVAIGQCSVPSGRQVAALRLVARTLDRASSKDWKFLGRTAYEVGVALEKSNSRASRCAMAFRVAVRALRHPALRDDASAQKTLGSAAQDLAEVLPENSVEIREKAYKMAITATKHPELRDDWLACATQATSAFRLGRMLDKVEAPIRKRVAAYRTTLRSFAGSIFKDDASAQAARGEAAIHSAKVLRDGGGSAAEMQAAYKFAMRVLNHETLQNKPSAQEKRGEAAFLVGNAIHENGGDLRAKRIAYRMAVRILGHPNLRNNAEARENRGLAAFNLARTFDDSGAGDAKEAAAYQIAVRALGHPRLRNRALARKARGSAAYNLGGKSGLPIEERLTSYKVALQAFDHSTLLHDVEARVPRGRAAYNLGVLLNSIGQRVEAMYYFNQMASEFTIDCLREAPQPQTEFVDLCVKVLDEITGWPRVTYSIIGRTRDTWQKRAKDAVEFVLTCDRSTWSNWASLLRSGLKLEGTTSQHVEWLDGVVRYLSVQWRGRSAEDLADLCVELGGGCASCSNSCRQLINAIVEVYLKAETGLGTIVTQGLVRAQRIGRLIEFDVDGRLFGGARLVMETLVPAALADDHAHSVGDRAAVYAWAIRVLQQLTDDPDVRTAAASNLLRMARSDAAGSRLDNSALLYVVAQATRVIAVEGDLALMLCRGVIHDAARKKFAPGADLRRRFEQDAAAVRRLAAHLGSGTQFDDALRLLPAILSIPKDLALASDVFAKKEQKQTTDASENNEETLLSRLIRPFFSTGRSSSKPASREARRAMPILADLPPRSLSERLAAIGAAALVDLELDPGDEGSLSAVVWTPDGRLSVTEMTTRRSSLKNASRRLAAFANIYAREQSLLRETGSVAVGQPMISGTKIPAEWKTAAEPAKSSLWRLQEALQQRGHFDESLLRTYRNEWNAGYSDAIAELTDLLRPAFAQFNNFLGSETIIICPPTGIRPFMLGRIVHRLTNLAPVFTPNTAFFATGRASDVAAITGPTVFVSPQEGASDLCETELWHVRQKLDRGTHVSVSGVQPLSEALGRRNDSHPSIENLDVLLHHNAGQLALDADGKLPVADMISLSQFCAAQSDPLNTVALWACAAGAIKFDDERYVIKPGLLRELLSAQIRHVLAPNHTLLLAANEGSESDGAVVLHQAFHSAMDAGMTPLAAYAKSYKVAVAKMALTPSEELAFGDIAMWLGR